MPKLDKPPKDISPIVKIVLINYDTAKQDEYSKKFISPLIKGLLNRMQLLKAKITE